jgi:hypothetical protein
MGKWGIALAIVCACSSDPGGVPGPSVRVSGTRLRAAYWDGAGVRIPLGWFDSELGTECGFEKDVNGTYRCYPTYASYNTILYRDAFCADAVVTRSEYCPPELPTGYVRINSMGCDNIGEVHKIGDALPAGTPLHGRDSNGNCVPQMPAPTETAYALGPRLTDGNFVIATEQVGRGGRLAPVFLQANDGAREWWGIQDTQLGFRCLPSLAADAKMRCLPRDRNDVYTYRDAQCTQAVIERGVCGTASFASKSTGEMCGGTRVFKVGVSVDVPMLYENFGRCTQQPPPAPSRQFVAVGDEIPAEMMAPMTSDEIGSGRIHERIWRDSDGNIVWRNYGWQDTQLGAEVYVQPYGPAQWALIPSPVYGGFTYTDAACSHPVGDFYGEACYPERMPTVIEIFGASGMVCPTHEFRQLGTQLAPQTIYQSNSMQCMPQMVNDPNHLFFDYGDPVDPSTFFVQLLPTHG